MIKRRASDSSTKPDLPSRLFALLFLLAFLTTLTGTFFCLAKLF